MELPSYFDDFLPLISPDERQRKLMIAEHTKLRELLMKDEVLKPILISTFIQGSQRRFTSTRGSKAHPCDVDLVTVTNLPRSSVTAAYAHELFLPFLERHYPGKYEAQDRSWCLKVDDEVTMDLVPTSEPDSPKLREAIAARELREWYPDETVGLRGALGVQTLTEAIMEKAKRDKDWDKTEPIWIPDRERMVWEQTHPLYLIGWTAAKNLACNGRFAQVVRVLKWWRRYMEPLPKYPKGYPLEHLIGECCPDGITSVAEGVTRTLEEIARRYAAQAARNSVPFLPARGVSNPEIDVMRRVTGADFAGFHARAAVAARLARLALDAKSVHESATLWGQLLGDKFPKPPEVSTPPTRSFTPPTGPARPSEGRFA